MLRLHAVATVCAVVLALLQSPSSAAGDPAGLAPAPVDFVVLVDESGSLSDSDVAAERAAASLLALGEVSDDSRAAVLGFGSVTGRGQTPVDTVCPLTRLDTVGREQLSSCTAKLHRRSEREGNGTDFPAALAQALSVLAGGADGTPKVVFLLTDGRLDVSASPAYGGNASSRNVNGRRALADKVAQARAQKVQIWPLGFGSGVDRSQLAELAAGGYRSRCADIPSARPTARVTSDSSDVASVLLAAFAGARCARTTPSRTVENVTSGADLKVTIPSVATDGSLEVVKPDADAVAVTYYDPRGRKVPPHGSAYGSSFERVGQSGPVEALRIRNPYPGTWRVHVQVLDGAAAQRITATAIWQGLLRSYILVDPPTPQPGQRVTARVTLQTRKGVVLTEEDQLAGIHVAVRLTGRGFATRTVALADDGRGPDNRAHDGEFSARITVPKTATGALTFVGVMAGEGIAGDQRPYVTEAVAAAPRLTAAIVLDDHEVNPGGTATGRLELRNSDSAAHRLRLAWVDGTADKDLTVRPQALTVRPGAVTRVPLGLAFGENARPGAVPGRLELRDQASGRLVAQSFVTVEVVPPATFLERNATSVGAGSALVLALLTVLALRRQDRRRARDTSDIQLILYRDDAELSRLRAPARAGAEFGFTLRPVAGGSHRLLLDSSAGRSRVRRSADGGLAIRLADGTRVPLPRGGRSPVADGLLLGFADHRPAARSRGAARTAGRVQDRRSGSADRLRQARDGAPKASRPTLTARRPYDDDF
ncbi:vWA domain-containing protein [Streptomyces populi]|uniref:vWA domain-containing protein n=1 Tax=Streptomyces populi TaxID=2058924 RepID=UPI0013A6956B|nr:vWA domain-containing protein [Streptomyces populi]